MARNSVIKMARNSVIEMAQIRVTKMAKSEANVIFEEIVKFVIFATLVILK